MMNQMTFRNILAIGILVAGASWLWLTPMWLSQGKANVSIFDPRGLLSVLAIIGFAVAAWGVFKSANWWEPVAIASALVGISAAFVFWFWASPSSNTSQADIATNALLHVAASALVVAVLLVKPAEHWLAGHL